VGPGFHLNFAPGPLSVSKAEKRSASVVYPSMDIFILDQNKLSLTLSAFTAIAKAFVLAVSVIKSTFIK
jgi:hypothetical protein